MKNRLITFLRWSEKYTKTDMVYLASAFFWTNLTVIATTLLALALSIAYANLLSKETYGTYQYLISLSGLIASLSLSGMGSAVVQAVARGYEGAVREGFRAQLRWSVIPATAAIAGGMYYLSQGQSDIGLGLLIIAICTPFMQSFGMYGNLIEAKRDFRRSFYFSFIVNTSPYFALLAVITWVKQPALLLLINLGATTIALFYAYTKTLRLYKPNNHIDPKTLSYGRHLSVLNTWGSIISQVDSVLVFHFLGSTSLAIYSFATLMPERIGSIFSFIGNASLPKLAIQPFPYIQKHLGTKLLRVALMSTFVALLYALFAPLIFHWFFPKYLDAIGYAQIYAPIIALLAVNNVTNSVFYAKRLTREIYIYSLFQPLLLIALQVPLLIHFGIIGMIYARLATDIIAIGIMLMLIYHPLSRIEPEESLPTV